MCTIKHDAKFPFVDWRVKLMQLLDCIGASTGTWHATDWERFGITPDEQLAIEASYEEWDKSRGT